MGDITGDEKKTMYLYINRKLTMYGYSSNTGCSNMRLGDGDGELYLAEAIPRATSPAESNTHIRCDSAGGRASLGIKDPAPR